MKNIGLQAADVTEDTRCICQENKYTILMFNYFIILVYCVKCFALGNDRVSPNGNFYDSYSRDSRFKSRLAPEYHVNIKYFSKSLNRMPT
jgi:hypothetical protein